MIMFSLTCEYLKRFPFTRGFFFSLVLLISFFCTVEAGPKRYSYDEENAILLRELRDSVDDLRHEVNNHETEIRMYEEKLSNQETIIDSLRQQLNESLQANKQLLQEAILNIELKITSLETTTKGLVGDLRQFKNYANESSSSLAQYKQKFAELEKVLESQNQNMVNLQAALKALMDAVQVKSGISNIGNTQEGSSKNYHVKSGDSLEKIARNNQTTIQALRELNGLTTDKIKVGQILQLP